jgi:hypothetical protein
MDTQAARDTPEEDCPVKLTPPTQIVFWISVALGVLGFLGGIGVVAALAAYAFWLTFIGLALLVLALLVKGL